MAPRRSRIAAPVLAAALVLAACGDDDTGPSTAGTVAETTSTSGAAATTSTTAAATTATTLPDGADQLIEVSVTGTTVEGGGRHAVAVGDTVAIVVTTDAVDQVHVHGYDVYADIGPDAPTTVLVEATVPGVWEVELHDTGTVLLELAVS